MLVKFTCGCIGFNTHPKALIVAPCDVDRDEPRVSMFWRNMDAKTHVPLDQDASKELVDELILLIADGHRFREMQALLQVGRSGRGGG
jgi:hypothetical protein